MRGRRRHAESDEAVGAVVGVTLSRGARWKRPGVVIVSEIGKACGAMYYVTLSQGNTSVVEIRVQ